MQKRPSAPPTGAHRSEAPPAPPRTSQQKAVDTAYKQGYAAGRRLANKEEAERLEMERREDRRTALFAAALTGATIHGLQMGWLTEQISIEAARIARQAMIDIA